MNEKELDRLVQISNKDVEQYFILDDGRIIFNGIVFRDEDHLQRYLKSSKQVFSFMTKIKNLFKRKYKADKNLI
jgi:hypothetical protein